ncbi:hypothetical protein [Phytoactinopolyspora endophytica]|uniref:hypothetical protein n=1 Tax=Phytoactinopolyspora endophytica TaxID=1642495 RepID=UPI00101DFC7A|nr:hypothetical protein [Phytoactinopolyspora endophytica]
MSNDIGTIPEHRQLSADRHAALRRSMLRQFSAEQHRPLYKRPQSVAVGAATVLALGTAAAATYIDSKHVPPSDQLRCYSKAELGRGDDFPGVTMGRATTPGTEEEAVFENAIDGCATAWRTGMLVEGADEPADLGDSDPNENNFPVPRLAACVLKDGVIGVFPGGSSTCRTLGLPELAPAAE